MSESTISPKVSTYANEDINPHAINIKNVQKMNEA